MARNREFIKLEEEKYRDLVRCGRKHDEFEKVGEEVNYTDLSKGYSEINIFLKRKSDGKFFKGSFIDGEQNYEEYQEDFVEVFPVTKTIIEYE
jgi:hypothetical protein